MFIYFVYGFMLILIPSKPVDLTDFLRFLLSFYISCTVITISNVNEAPQQSRKYAKSEEKKNIHK